VAVRGAELRDKRNKVSLANGDNEWMDEAYLTPRETRYGQPPAEFNNIFDETRRSVVPKCNDQSGACLPHSSASLSPVRTHGCEGQQRCDGARRNLEDEVSL
jgi:hypothetical protein